MGGGAHLVERLTSAQVMISRFVSLSPMSGSLLSHSPSRALFGSSVPRSLCPSLACALSQDK